ncbi:MAG TPA: GNAT family N-acetyltransferase [Fimbriimonas sp.]|nr:GNAT family N-acetyltransferase [Fimbriimonas sp.]
MAWQIREAKEADYPGIAEAHVASIKAIGPSGYSQEVVELWAAPRDASIYRAASANGESFFVAEDDRGAVIGFSSARYSDVATVAVYVRGDAARIGVGSALLAAAEARLRELGASEIVIDASLTAVRFYETNGYEALGRAEHVLSSGGAMACERMAKSLA